MEKVLKILVLMKQVPDIEKVKFDYQKGRLDRSSAGAIINPFDLNALEVALQLKEKKGGIITVLTMGPRKAEDSLRDVLARGADNAILLMDKKFAGSDTLATSYTLTGAIKKLPSFDLVICGEKTIDGDTGQVGSEVAEILGIPHIAYVEEVVDVEEDGLIVKTRTDKNYYVMKLSFPGLITVTKDVNTPRLPTLRDRIRSRRTEISILTSKDLEEDDGKDTKFGHSGSPTWVVRVYIPVDRREKAQIMNGTVTEKARKIAGILFNLKMLR